MDSKKKKGRVSKRLKETGLGPVALVASWVQIPSLPLKI